MCLIGMESRLNLDLQLFLARPKSCWNEAFWFPCLCASVPKSHFDLLVHRILLLLLGRRWERRSRFHYQIEALVYLTQDVFVVRTGFRGRKEERANTTRRKPLAWLTDVLLQQARSSVLDLSHDLRANQWHKTSCPPNQLSKWYQTLLAIVWRYGQMGYSGDDHKPHRKW